MRWINQSFPMCLERHFYNRNKRIRYNMPKSDCMNELFTTWNDEVTVYIAHVLEAGSPRGNEAGFDRGVLHMAEHLQEEGSHFWLGWVDPNSSFLNNFLLRTPGSPAGAAFWRHLPPPARGAHICQKQLPRDQGLNSGALVGYPVTPKP